MKAIQMMKRFVAGFCWRRGAVHAAPPVTTYFHNDLAGSPVAATNEAGQVIWREGYYPYGERLQKPLTDSRGYISGSGTRNGVDVKVIYDTANGRIVTGYPTNVGINP